MNIISVSFKKKLYLALFAVLPSLVIAENVLVNGNFESGSSTGWVTWGGQISGRLQYEGTYGAGVYSSEHQWRGLSQKISIPQNARTFLLEGMMKTDEVVGGKESWEKAGITIGFLNEVDSSTGNNASPVASVTGTTDWTKYSRKYSIDFTARFIQIVLALGNATGAVQFDNLSLVFFDENGAELKNSDLKFSDLPLIAKHNEAKNKLANGDFEDGTNAWGAWGKMVDKGGINGSSCLYLGRVQNEKWALQTIPLPKKIHRIVMTGFIATDNVVQGDESWKCASICAELLNSRGERLGNYLQSIGNINGTTSFKEYSVMYPVVSDAVSIRITCGMNGESGIAMFDNVKVTFFDVNGNEVR